LENRWNFLEEKPILNCSTTFSKKN